MVATAPVSVRSASLSPLTAWLLASGAKMDGVAVKWLGDSMGAGLIATRDLSPGTDVCAVPRSLLLSCTSGLSDPVLGSLLEDLQFELEDEANLYDASQGTISLQLLYAAACVQRGEETRWAPYIPALPTHVDTPALWTRAERNALLAGTSLLADTRELRGDMANEYRRIRRALRQSGRAEWLTRLGLDASAAPCPLSGRWTPAVERWTLAQSLVRSRAYVVPDDGEDDHGALDELAGDEMIMSPLIDLANHDSALPIGVGWGDGVGAPADNLLLRTGCDVSAGSPVLTTYGNFSVIGSMLAFGFSTPDQHNTLTCRLTVDPTDLHAEQKRAVLDAAGVLRHAGHVSFELPSRPPEVSGELLQTLRLLALPPSDAQRLLDGARPLPDEEHGGFGEPPILSATGEDIWEALAVAGPVKIERAAYAKMLRVCRTMGRALRDGSGAMDRAKASGEAPERLVSAAATARAAEAEALQVLVATARREARMLPRA